MCIIHILGEMASIAIRVRGGGKRSQGISLATYSDRCNLKHGVTLLRLEKEGTERSYPLLGYLLVWMHAIMDYSLTSALVIIVITFTK